MERKPNEQNTEDIKQHRVHQRAWSRTPAKFKLHTIDMESQHALRQTLDDKRLRFCIFCTSFRVSITPTSLWGKHTGEHQSPKNQPIVLHLAWLQLKMHQTLAKTAKFSQGSWFLESGLRWTSTKMQCSTCKEIFLGCEYGRFFQIILSIAVQLASVVHPSLISACRWDKISETQHVTNLHPNAGCLHTILHWFRFLQFYVTNSNMNI